MCCVMTPEVVSQPVQWAAVCWQDLDRSWHWTHAKETNLIHWTLENAEQEDFNVLGKCNKLHGKQGRCERPKPKIYVNINEK